MIRINVHKNYCIPVLRGLTAKLEKLFIYKRSRSFPENPDFRIIASVWDQGGRYHIFASKAKEAKARRQNQYTIEIHYDPSSHFSRGGGVDYETKPRQLAERIKGILGNIKSAPRISLEELMEIKRSKDLGGLLGRTPQGLSL